MISNLKFALTKDYILSKISEEEIFTKYLGIAPTDKGSYTNPKRKDNDPGCSFYVDDRGRWKFKDFARGFNWDCFNVVEYEYDCSFKEALIKIAIDFNLIDGTKSDIVFNKRSASKRKVQLRVKRRSWTREDLAYWLQFGVTEETLSRGNVSPISHAWFLENGIYKLAYYHKDSDPAFVYHFGEYDYKIYFPFRPKGRKFLQSSFDSLQGYDLLPAHAANLLITKSYKDVLALYSYSHKFDLYSVAPLSEYIVMSIDQFSDLYNRFDNIATLFDFDRTGITLMRKYESLFKLPFYMFGKEYKVQMIKDFADHRKIKGDYETQKLIERFTKPLY
jgi:hypothetical protein